VVREHILYDFSSFKDNESCAIKQSMVCIGKYAFALTMYVYSASVVGFYEKVNDVKVVILQRTV
jgi:hypothetical protein